MSREISIPSVGERVLDLDRLTETGAMAAQLIPDLAEAYEVPFTNAWCRGLAGRGLRARPEVACPMGRIDIVINGPGPSCAVEAKMWIEDVYGSRLAKHWNWDLRKLRHVSTDHAVFAMLVASSGPRETRATLAEVRERTSLPEPSRQQSGHARYGMDPYDWVLWIWQIR